MDLNTNGVSWHSAYRVGNFLTSVMDELKTALLFTTSLNVQLNPDPVNVSLISAHNYTNLKITKLIYQVFDGKFPWYFQLFRCSLSTTVEEIELFFDRIDHFPQYKYLVLGIDLIKNELQQVNHIRTYVL